MIDSVKDLGLDEIDLDSENVYDLIDQALQEKLNISLLTIKESLSKAIINKAEELSLECPNIAPYGNYDKLLEDNDSMTEFFKTEASKLENLLLNTVAEDTKQKQLLCFGFLNKSLEDFKGTVYVSKSGVVRHSYPRIEL
jgi:hypothetical protein